MDDDGPGIPAAQYEDAFKAFNRLDEARNQNIKGVGLGLAIARSIVEGHQGRISIGDREDAQRGASFVVRLPMAVARDPGIVSE